MYIVAQFPGVLSLSPNNATQIQRNKKINKIVIFDFPQLIYLFVHERR